MRDSLTQLSAAVTINQNTAALLDGSVVPAECTWAIEGLGPGELFYRQLKFRQYDVSELSISSLAIGMANGDRTWVGLQVFTSREFYHAGIIVREDSPIGSPRELRGARLGVLEYQQTSVVWIRGILQHQFGVNPEDVEWFMERQPNKSHGGATGFSVPPNIRLNYVPEERSLAELLEAGEIDAILFLPPADAIDFKPGDARERLRRRPLFADPAAETRRYFAATGVIPVNHCVVVRRSIADEYPEILPDIYRAFVRAKAAGFAEYGVESNRKALETLLTYLFEQHLSPRQVQIDEIF
jgi:4,5-dihydroxyphthalate decarboxylase